MNETSFEFIINPQVDPCSFFVYRVGSEFIHYQYADFKKGTSRSEFRKELEVDLNSNPIIISKLVFIRYAIEVEKIFEDLQEAVFSKWSINEMRKNLNEFLSKMDLTSYKNSFIETIIYDHSIDVIKKYYEQLYEE